MSVVTNIILVTPITFEEDMPKLKRKINSFFNGEHGYRTPGFVAVEDKKLPKGWYGGTKMLETELWIGAFNHINLDDLVEHLRKIKWEYPEEVQLIVKEQEEDRFEIIDIN